MKREYNYIPEWNIDGSEGWFEDNQTFIDEHIRIDARTQGKCDVIYSEETYSTPSSVDLMNKKYDVEVLAVYDSKSGIDFEEVMVSSFYNEITNDYKQKIFEWYKDVM